jgi:hypothetical protein
LDEKKRATRGTVIIDTVYELDDEIKILWEDKSPKVFDKIFGDFIDEARAHAEKTIPFIHPDQCYSDFQINYWRNLQHFLSRLFSS